MYFGIYFFIDKPLIFQYNYQRGVVMKNKTVETKIINKMFSITNIVNCYEFETIKKWTHFPPEINFCDFTFILNGEAKFYTKNKKYNVKKGDLFFRNKNTHFHSEGNEGFHFLTLRFYIGKDEKLDFLKRIYHVENFEYYQNMFYEAIKLYDQKSYMYNIKIAAIIYNIVAALVTSDISKDSLHIKYKKI